MPLNRRDALKSSSVLVGGALLASGPLLAACSSGRDAPVVASGHAIDAADTALFEEIADTILPTTPSSPGARVAGAGAAMTLLLTDCYDLAAQTRVAGGLVELRTRCRERCGGSFTTLSPMQREQLLQEIDAEAQRAGNTHWFHLVRELSLRAYFSSEVGMTKALRYVMVPGRWTGCVPLAPGQPAWG
jgi:hypothetical protein